jgi:hypothetical protein
MTQSPIPMMESTYDFILLCGGQKLALFIALNADRKNVSKMLYQVTNPAVRLLKLIVLN